LNRFLKKVLIENVVHNNKTTIANFLCVLSAQKVSSGSFLARIRFCLVEKFIEHRLVAPEPENTFYDDDSPSKMFVDPLESHCFVAHSIQKEGVK